MIVSVAGMLWTIRIPSPFFHLLVNGFYPRAQASRVMYSGWFLCHQKKIVIERTRDLIYLKFVAKDFSPKIISPSAGENSGDSA